MFDDPGHEGNNTTSDDDLSLHFHGGRFDFPKIHCMFDEENGIASDVVLIFPTIIIL